MANGGPVTLIYGFVYAWLGAATTALSFREMASMYPSKLTTRSPFRRSDLPH